MPMDLVSVLKWVKRVAECLLSIYLISQISPEKSGGKQLGFSLPGGSSS